MSLHFNYCTSAVLYESELPVPSAVGDASVHCCMRAAVMRPLDGHAAGDDEDTQLTAFRRFSSGQSDLGCVAVERLEKALLCLLDNPYPTPLQPFLQWYQENATQRALL